MKVTQVSTWQVQCGIASYTALLREGLERQGVSCDVVPIDREHTGYLAKRELGAYFDRLGDELADADVVHIQHEFGFFAGSYHFRTSVTNFRRVLRAAQRHARAVVVSFHSLPFYVDWAKLNWSSEDPVRQLLLGAAKGWWRVGVAPLINANPRTMAHVHGRLGRRLLIDSGISPSRIEPISHGTPRPRAPVDNQTRAAVRERLGLAQDATVLCIFGFLASSKGQMDAVAALDHLPENFQLLLVGGPHPLDSRSVLGDVVEQLALKPRLSDRVAVTGYLDADEAWACVDAADIMLAPYRDDAQAVSGALGWALASGKPVIASRIPAFREIVEESGSAELVAASSPGELALTIERVAQDEALRERLVSNATAWCEANSWDAVAKRHAELYADLARGTIGNKAKHSGVRPLATRPTSSLPLRAAALPPDRMVVEEFPKQPRRIHASAVLRTGALPDGRQVTFAIDPNAPDDPLARLVLQRGYPGDLPCELTLHLLGSDATFVDVGAHLGTFTLAAAANGCRVLALEASHINARLLRTAVAYNGFDSVTVVHGAAAASSGVVRFRERGLFGAVDVQGPAGNGDARPGREVLGYRVGDLVEREGLGKVSVVKLDVEGYELEALAGMHDLLVSPAAPALVFESNAAALGTRGSTVAELKQTLVDLGYTLFQIDRVSPGELVPVAAQDLQPEASADYLAFKQPPSNLAPWRVAEPFDRSALVERLRSEAGSVGKASRAYVAAVLRVAPAWVSEDPLIRATAIDLRQDAEIEVVRMIDGRDPVARFGLPEPDSASAAAFSDHATTQPERERISNGAFTL